MTESKKVKGWLLPANTKYFDIISHFKKNKTVIWRQKKGMNLNDDAYIYLAKPYGFMKFKCKIIEINIAQEELNAKSYAITNSTMNYAYMKIALRKVYKDGAIPFSGLKEHGLGQVSTIARVFPGTVEYIEKASANKGGDN